MEIKRHFGVYTVCFENGKLLCIEKREVLINIGMIYLVVVSNLEKAWRKLWLEKFWKRRDLPLEATPILESTMFSSGKS